MSKLAATCKIGRQIGCQPINGDLAGDLARPPRVNRRFPIRKSVYHRSFARHDNGGFAGLLSS